MRNRRMDGVGLFLNWLVISSASFCALATPLFVYARLDPYYYLLKDLTPTTMKDVAYFKWTLVGFRLLLSFSNFSQFCQIFISAVTVYSLNNRAASACIFYLAQLHSKDKQIEKLIQCIEWYDELRITLRFVEPLKGGLEFLLLSCGFIVTVMSNWITLKLNDVIPMPVYLLFPMISIISISISVNIIPKAVALSISSRELLESWRSEIPRGSLDMRGKYVRRRLLSLSPVKWTIRVTGFSLKELVKAFKIKYFGGILYYTVNCVISFDLGNAADYN